MLSGASGRKAQPQPPQLWPSHQEAAQGPQAWGWARTQAPVCPPLCPAKCSCFYLGLTAFGGACFLLHSQGLGFWVQKQEHPYV